MLGRKQRQILELQNRINELENILCPFNQHDFIKLVESMMVVILFIHIMNGLYLVNVNGVIKRLLNMKFKEWYSENLLRTSCLEVWNTY